MLLMPLFRPGQRTGVVTGALATGLIVAGVLWSGNQAGVPAGADGSVTFTFQGSDVFPLDEFHLRRALVGGTLSRSWASWESEGTRYVVSFQHNGSRADPTEWEPELAGAQHAFADLGASAVAAADVAQGFVDAAATLGQTCARNDASVTCDGSGPRVGEPFDPDTDVRGMWGMQRHDWGGAATSNSNGAMGGTGSVHLDSPGIGRVLGLYVRAVGGLNVRLGVANGPAYSTTPGAFSNMQEGVAAAVDSNDLGVVLFSDPWPMDATDKWISYRGVAAETTMFRFHGETVVGRGDLGLDERLVWSTTDGDDPSVAISSGGAYTPSPTADFGIYVFVGFIYELEGANGYHGDGSIDTWIGYLGSAAGGGPTGTDPADMGAETFTMRHPAPPWTEVNATQVAVSVAAAAADEDMGMSFYEWNDLTIPSSGSHPLLFDAGLFGGTSTGFVTHVLATPLPVGTEALGASSVFGVTFNAGNLDGVTPTDTISVYYDPDTSSLQGWLTAWIDDGRTWSDMIPAGGGGFGQSTEYRTTAGAQPQGDPNAAAPDPFVVDPTDDGPRNHLRHRVRLQRAGLTGTEN